MKQTTDFYPILDLDTCIQKNIQPESLPELWQNMGITYYQVRAKNISEKTYLELSFSLKKKYEHLDIIANDFVIPVLNHPEIFSGLHLGQEDIASLSDETYSLLREHSRKDGFISGISTHNLKQINLALEDIRESHGEKCTEFMRWSYIAVGPVAGTTSKPSGTDPVLSERNRIEIFNEIEKSFRIFSEKSIPPPGVVIIGGLTPDLYSRVKDDCGCSFIPIPAVISSAIDVKSLEAWRSVIN